MPGSPVSLLSATSAARCCGLTLFGERFGCRIGDNLEEAACQRDGRPAQTHAADHESLDALPAAGDPVVTNVGRKAGKTPLYRPKLSGTKWFSTKLITLSSPSVGSGWIAP